MSDQREFSLMTKNDDVDDFDDGADDEDDQHHGHLLESFSLLPEELGPISLIVSNTINLQNIIFDNDGEGDGGDDGVEGEEKTDGDADEFVYTNAFLKFVLSVHSYRLETNTMWTQYHGQILTRGQR